MIYQQYITLRYESISFRPPAFGRTRAGTPTPQPTGRSALQMAIADDLILVTFDKRIGHLGGESGERVLILWA